MTEAQKELWEKIEDVRTAMLTTAELDGSLRSRPMWTRGDEFDGTLWSFASDESPLEQYVTASETQHQACPILLPRAGGNPPGPSGPIPRLGGAGGGGRPPGLPHRARQVGHVQAPPRRPANGRPPRPGWTAGSGRERTRKTIQTVWPTCRAGRSARGASPRGWPRTTCTWWPSSGRTGMWPCCGAAGGEPGAPLGPAGRELRPGEDPAARGVLPDVACMAGPGAIDRGRVGEAHRRRAGRADRCRSLTEKAHAHPPIPTE